MSSKKASFGSQDPTHVDDTPDRDPFGSRDPVSPGDAVEFTMEADAATTSDISPDNTSPFESRDLSDPDLPQQHGAVSDQASFYSRDTDLGTGDASESDDKKYMGEERRKTNRRSGHDRRSDVRFDLDKSDRRQSDGRRNDDASVKYW